MEPYQYYRDAEKRSQGFIMKEENSPMDTSVTVSQCYSVTVSQCYSVTVLQCYSVTVLQCYSVTVSQCHSVTVSQCYSVTVSQLCCAGGFTHSLSEEIDS